jgi:hypothetical protein
MGRTSDWRSKCRPAASHRFAIRLPIETKRHRPPHLRVVEGWRIPVDNQVTPDPARRDLADAWADAAAARTDRNRTFVVSPPDLETAGTPEIAELLQRIRRLAELSDRLWVGRRGLSKSISEAAKGLIVTLDQPRSTRGERPDNVCCNEEKILMRRNRSVRRISAYAVHPAAQLWSPLQSLSFTTFQGSLTYRCYFYWVA